MSFQKFYRRQLNTAQVTLHRTAHAGGAAGRWIADVAHGQKGGAALALLVRLSGCICIIIHQNFRFGVESS